VTIGAQFQQPKIQLKNGNTLKINLWDTAGEEKFRSMLPMYYKDAKAGILVYDIGNEDSFSSIDYWIDALSDHIAKQNIPLFLVGNKKDLDPELKKVETTRAQAYAKEHNMMFTEVSAKTSEGIVELFKSLAEELSVRFNY